MGSIKTLGGGSQVSIKLIGEELFPTFTLRKFTYKFAKVRAFSKGTKNTDVIRIYVVFESRKESRLIWSLKSIYAWN